MTQAIRSRSDVALLFTLIGFCWAIFKRMTPPQKNERMRVDAGLATKIGIYNAIGLILVVASPMIVDPRLQSRFDNPDRHYAMWIWGLLLLAVPVFYLTKVLVTDRDVSRKNYLRAFFILFTPAGIIAAVVFRPEVPHLGGLLLAVAYGSLSVITVACRQSRDNFVYLNNPLLEYEARLERLKASVSTWQLVSVYGMATYIGFVAVALSMLWTIAGYMVKDSGERFFLGKSYILQMTLYSICVGTGPLHECFEMMFGTVRQLSSIKESPEPQG